MLTLSLQHSYQAYYYPINDQQNALNDYLFRNNSSLISRYKDSLNYNTLEQLHLKTTEILIIMSNIQKKMVQESEGEPGKPALSNGQISQTETGQKILYGELSRPFDPEPAKAFLISGCSTRTELNSSMTEYINYLTSIAPAGDLPKYKKMVETEIFLPSAINREISLMSGLHTLEIMKNGVLTVESCVINSIVRH